MNLNRIEEYSEYFRTPEFKTLFDKYETMKRNGLNGYFEADEFIDIAEYYYNNKEKEAAIDTLEYASRIHPDNIDIKIFKARTYMMEGDYQLAKNIADMIVDQQDKEVLFLKAEIEISQRNIHEAETYLNQLIDNENEIEDLCYTLMDIGELFMDYEEYERGHYYFITAETKASDCNNLGELIFNLQSNRAICLFGIGKHPEAIELINRILDEDPYSYEHWCLLGEFYMELHEFDKAIDAFDYALAIHTDCNKAIFWKACCFTNLDNIELALNLFEQCIDKSYKKSESHYGCGLLYNATGFYEKAIKHLLKSEEIKSETDPSFSLDLYLNLAEAYIQSEQAEKAEHYLHLAEQISKENKKVKELNLLIKYMKEKLQE